MDGIGVAAPQGGNAERSTPPRPPAGDLVFHVFGAIAHFERRLIAERTKDGIAAARARGKRLGLSR
jgi:DNA invertase Pin-like site-specific DNA recombinase